MAHVLVVDDDESLVAALVEALVADGHRVSAASNGLQALDIVRATDEADRPDIVLLDLRLPVLDGQEFADAWRTADPNGLVPVIVVSGSHEVPPGIAERIPVRDAITKPFDLDDLLGRIRHTLRDRADSTLLGTDSINHQSQRGEESYGR